MNHGISDINGAQTFLLI